DTVVGGLGDDTVRGGFGDDELFGNAGNDFLTGDAGVDLLTGGRGNDRIDGGRGVDTVIYSGDIADYTFLLLGNGDIRVTDNVGNDGVDRVSTVEFCEFSDGIVAAADLPF
ncbi:MAG: alkaline metalloproteinase, partial [Pseudomonadota bacterium]